jgi:ribosomal protein S18 acetylase RimI-like enzyme
MPDGFEISVAERADAQLLEAAGRLIPQLSSSTSPRKPTLDELRAVLESPTTTLLVVRAGGGPIVGMLALVLFRIPTGVRAFIEDVAVDAAFRGKGLGEGLTKRAIDLALSRGARTVELTSRPERVAANQLYRKLGFQRRETNVYRLDASRSGVLPPLGRPSHPGG